MITQHIAAREKPKNSSMTETNTSTPVVTFEGSPFRLHQPFPPAGDQPEAIRLLVEGVGDGLVIPDPAHGTAGQDLHHGQTSSPVPDARHWYWPRTRPWAAQLYSEFKASFSRKTPSSILFRTTTTTSQKSHVPSRDLLIEKRDSAINDHIEQMRLSATKSPQTSGATW